MFLKRHFFKFLVLFLLFVLAAACAPKRVRIYDVPEKIRGDVVSSALGLQGRPYKNGARGPDAFDCSGLVYYVFRQHRILLPPPAESQSRAGREVNRYNALPGDLVLFRIDGDFHIGIVINRKEFVHASKSRGVAVDSVDADYWRKRLVGYRSVL